MTCTTSPPPFPHTDNIHILPHDPTTTGTGKEEMKGKIGVALALYD